MRKTEKVVELEIIYEALEEARNEARFTWEEIVSQGQQYDYMHYKKKLEQIEQVFEKYDELLSLEYDKIERNECNPNEPKTDKWGIYVD